MIWGILILLLAFAGAFALRPLLKRNPGVETTAREHDLSVYKAQLLELDADRRRGVLSGEEFAASRLEIQRRILKADKNSETGNAGKINRAFPAIVIGLTLLAAGLLYLDLGEPTVPGISPGRQQSAPQIPGEPSMEELLTKLRAHLETSPDDADGWQLLARSLATLGRYGDAVSAYDRLAALDPENPDWLVEKAETLVRMGGGAVSPAALLAFEQSAEMAPDHPAPPFYRGLASFQTGNIEEAYDIWVKLAARSNPAAPWMAPLRTQIAAAEQRLGIAPALPELSEDDLAAVANLSAEERRAFVESMVARLADRLRDNPDDLDGWLRLARARMTLGQNEAAVAALKQAEPLATGILAEQIRSDISALDTNR